MVMTSVFFSETIRPHAPNISTKTDIIFAIPCGDCDTMQASSAYSIPHTACMTTSSAVSGPIPFGDLSRCTRSPRISAFC